VSIKVDRESGRTSISIYMEAVQMMTGTRGWPSRVRRRPVRRFTRARTSGDDRTASGFRRVLGMWRTPYRDRRGDVRRGPREVIRAQHASVDSNRRPPLLAIDLDRHEVFV